MAVLLGRRVAGIFVAFRWTRAFSFLILVAISSFAAAGAFAQADEYAGHVVALLNDGWRSGEAALARAKTNHQAAIELDRGDARADYALALVHLRRSQWPEALQVLDQATAKNPHDLYVWRGRLWLKVYQRDYALALDDLDAFAKAMPTPAADAAVEGRWQAAAKIMGRVYGYLDGPRAGAIAEEELQVRKSKLLAKLSDARQAAFAAGEAGIAAEHQQKLDAIAAEQDQTLADNEAEKDQQREFVDSEKARIEATMAQLQQAAAEAKNVLDQDLSKFEQELSPIRQSYASVLAQARPFQLRIRDLQNRLASAMAEARAAEGGKSEEEKNRNRDRRQRAEREAERLRFELRREEELLRPFVVEAQRLQAQAAVIEQYKRAALARYQAAYGSLDAEARKLQRGGRLLKASEREIERTASGTSGKVVDMRARLPLWQTYETFPLEDERQRLLATLRGG